MKKYRIFVFKLSSSEKIKNLNYTNLIINKLFKLNFNRSDVVIGIGGGIVGDMSGFISSIYKRGINFINLQVHYFRKLTLVLVEKQVLIQVMERIL